jgi:TatD DNase family protein
MKLVDTHCHLCSEKLSHEASELISRAREASVAKIINITFDRDTFLRGLEQVKLHPELALTVGIQPHDADQFNETFATEIETVASAHKDVVAIGEIGLDGFHKFVDMPTQIKCFEAFLEMALRCNLPVVVHVRETFTDVYERLKWFSNRGGTGVIHCFTGSLDEGKAFLDLGFYLSFSGIVTFKNSDDLRAVAKHTPSDRLLIETDSPYLAPVPFRGKQNEPAWVKEVARCISEVRQVSLESIAELTTNNALSLFKKLQLH